MAINTESIEQPSGPSFMFRALKHRNYRLFFAGQGISMVGTWMTRIATGWLVYKLTGSALMLGIVGFAGQIPSFLLAPIAGVMVDRWNRHRLLVVTQALAMIQSLAIGVLALAWVGGFRPLEVPWLEAKLVGLVVYILAGTIALKRGRTAGIRATAFAVALLAYAYIVSVALTKHPLGWLAGGMA